MPEESSFTQPRLTNDTRVLLSSFRCPPMSVLRVLGAKPAGCSVTRPPPSCVSGGVRGPGPPPVGRVSRRSSEARSEGGRRRQQPPGCRGRRGVIAGRGLLFSAPAPGTRGCSRRQPGFRGRSPAFRRARSRFPADENCAASGGRDYPEVAAVAAGPARESLLRWSRCPSRLRGRPAWDPEHRQRRRG